MQAEEIKRLIEEGIPGAEAIIKGDGDHFDAVVISAAFDGISMVKQHQMVYATLGNAFEAALHALALKTYTPDQWAKNPRIQ